MKKIGKVLIIFLILFMFLEIMPVNALGYDFHFHIEQSGNNTSVSMFSSNDTVNSALQTSTSRGQAWNLILSRYKIFIVGFTGVVSISLIAFGMFAFSKLSLVADNPQKRQEAILHIGLILGAGMLLGIGSLIFGYAYNIFR